VCHKGRLGFSWVFVQSPEHASKYDAEMSTLSLCCEDKRYSEEKTMLHNELTAGPTWILFVIIEEIQPEAFTVLMPN